MKKLILSAGHSNMTGRDRGASGCGFIEGDLTVELRQLISNELKKLGLSPIMDGNNSILAESINSFKKFITQDAIALEIHFNSGPNNATGVETLTPANPSNNEITIASNLSQIIRDLMIIPLRGKNGVKSELESHHGKLGWMRQNCETVLLEVCFISNPEEMNRYQSTKFDIAKKIAAYLYNVCSGNIIKEAQKSIIHQVVAGETLTSISKIYNVKIDEIKLANNLQGDYLQIGQKLRIIT